MARERIGNKGAYVVPPTGNPLARLSGIGKLIRGCGNPELRCTRTAWRRSGAQRRPWRGRSALERLGGRAEPGTTVPGATRHVQSLRA